jgi:hypothetical protein
MDAETIRAYREAYYDALCGQASRGGLNLSRERLEARFRHLAFDSPDEDIVALAEACTPAEAAAEELM